jgi:hypothetical protein
MKQKFDSVLSWLSEPAHIRYILFGLMAVAVFFPEASALAENAGGGSGG